MKNKLLIILFIIFSGCEGILELQPTDSISSDIAILNESDLQNVIRGCYDALQFDGYYGRLIIVIGDIGSDNAYNGGTILEYDQFNKNSVEQDNRFLEEIWTTPYIAINRCNTAIFYTNNFDQITETKRDEYLAELRFLRALNYFNLTRLFKDLPLKLKPTMDTEDLNVPLSDQSIIYEQILEDLNFANNKIENTDPYYATDLAVKTLLAKVYLEIEDYEKANNYADLVISGDKELLESFDELFTIENNSESIFELSFTETLTDKNRLAEYCYPNNLGGRYEIAPEITLINSFEDEDVRKDLFLGNTPYCNKYESLTSGADNVYIFRLAELYLIRAEANARLQRNLTEVNNDINKIRLRAGLNNIFSSSYSELLDFIESERKHEFAFEGHRRFDLVRTGKASSVLGISKEDCYFPIPLSEINTNNQID